MEDALGLLVTVVRFVLLLTVLIMVHEAGHFFSARAFKVKVLEFGWGFPPRLFGIYTGRTFLSMPSDVYMVDLAGREHLRLRHEGPGPRRRAGRRRALRHRD